MPAQKSQKDRLQHILRIGGVAGDAIGGAEDERVMILEDAFQLASQVNFPFLDQCGVQDVPPALVLTPKDGRQLGLLQGFFVACKWECRKGLVMHNSRGVLCDPVICSLRRLALREGVKKSSQQSIRNPNTKF